MPLAGPGTCRDKHSVHPYGRGAERCRRTGRHSPADGAGSGGAHGGLWTAEPTEPGPRGQPGRRTWGGTRSQRETESEATQDGPGGWHSRKGKDGSRDLRRRGRGQLGHARGHLRGHGGGRGGPGRAAARPGDHGADLAGRRWKPLAWGRHVAPSVDSGWEEDGAQSWRPGEQRGPRGV